MSEDPFRDDAALVYRYIRDQPGTSVPELAEQCFGDVGFASVRRVLDSIVWMRHEGVVMTCVPGMTGLSLSTFTLGAVAFDPMKVARHGSVVREFVAEGVAESRDTQVSQPSKSKSKSMESDVMDIYHPK